MGTTEKTYRLSGNTYPIKDTISASGGRWDAASKTWTIKEKQLDLLEERIQMKFGANKKGREAKAAWDSVEVTEIPADEA